MVAVRSRPSRPLFRLICVLLAGLLTLPAYAKPPKKKTGPDTPPTASGPARIEVSSMTAGAEIVIDGAKVGNVPAPAPFEVAPDVDHTVRLQKRGFTPFVDTVRVKAGATYTVEADLVPSGGVLVVKANIPNAQVFVDGKPSGQTPFEGDVDVGRHTVKLMASGHKESTQTVEVKLGETAELSFTLEPIPVEPPKQPGLLGKWWFWSAIGVGVVGIGLTAALAGRTIEKAPPLPDATLRIP